MNERVGSLGELAWQLAAGDTSRHVLVISPEGDPARRALARRVVLAAPEADETWSYVDSRPPLPDLESITLGPDRPVRGPGERPDEQRPLRRPGPPPGVRRHVGAGAAEVTFLALDAALGENDTELWLGEVQPVEFPPLDGFGLTALRSVVQDLKRQRLDADGQPQWLLLSGETSQGPLQAMVRSPLHPVMAPHLDTYVSVAVPYPAQSDGLPGSEALELLRVFEHRLGARLGNEGQVVAHLSTGGVRTLHVYVDSTADVLPTVKEVARSWEHGKVTVHDMLDPGWQAVAHLRQ